MRPILAFALLCTSLVLALPHEPSAVDAIQGQTPTFDARAVASDPSQSLDKYHSISLKNRAANGAPLEREARSLDKRAPKTPKTVVIDGARMLSARTKLMNKSATDALKRR